MSNTRPVNTTLSNKRFGISIEVHPKSPLDLFSPSATSERFDKSQSPSMSQERPLDEVKPNIVSGSNTNSSSNTSLSANASSSANTQTKQTHQSISDTTKISPKIETKQHINNFFKIYSQYNQDKQPLIKEKQTAKKLLEHSAAREAFLYYLGGMEFNGTDLASQINNAKHDKQSLWSQFKMIVDRNHRPKMKLAQEAKDSLRASLSTSMKGVPIAEGDNPDKRILFLLGANLSDSPFEKFYALFKEAILHMTTHDVKSIGNLYQTDTADKFIEAISILDANGFYTVEGDINFWSGREAKKYAASQIVQSRSAGDFSALKAAFDLPELLRFIALDNRRHQDKRIDFSEQNKLEDIAIDEIATSIAQSASSYFASSVMLGGEVNVYISSDKNSEKSGLNKSNFFFDVELPKLRARKCKIILHLGKQSKSGDWEWIRKDDKPQKVYRYNRENHEWQGSSQEKIDPMDYTRMYRRFRYIPKFSTTPTKSDLTLKPTTASFQINGKTYSPPESEKDDNRFAPLAGSTKQQYIAYTESSARPFIYPQKLLLMAKKVLQKRIEKKQLLRDSMMDVITQAAEHPAPSRLQMRRAKQNLMRIKLNEDSWKELSQKPHSKTSSQKTLQVPSHKSRANSFTVSPREVHIFGIFNEDPSTIPPTPFEGRKDKEIDNSASSQSKSASPRNSVSRS